MRLPQLASPSDRYVWMPLGRIAHCADTSAHSQIVLTPISEDYGRKTIFIACLTLVYLLHIPIALAQNIETLMICRFLAGFMASPIFNVSLQARATALL